VCVCELHIPVRVGQQLEVEWHSSGYDFSGRLQQAHPLLESYCGVLWYIVVYYGVLWRTVVYCVYCVYCGVLWYTMVYCTVVYYGVLWRI